MESHLFLIRNFINISAGIPKVFGYYHEGEFNVMIMQLLGKNLEQLFEICEKKFTMKTILMLADKMVKKHPITHYEFD